MGARMQGRLIGPTFGVAAMRTAAGRGFAVMLAALALLLAAALAAAGAPKVQFSADGGHGRIVVEFPDRNMLPGYTASAVNGVLVLQFDEPVEMDVSRASLVLEGYVTIARADPDGRGARFALARGVQMNAMEAGPRLFVDLLPRSWSGPPPPLPQSVVEDLARRAEEASRIARQQELLRIAGADAARLEVRAARGPTFSRITFGWNIPFEATFERRENGVLVRFDATAPVDLGPVRADLPPFVDDISASATEEGGLAVLLSVSPSADVRAFREENTYVVDVQGNAETPAADPAIAALSQVGPDEGLPAGASMRVVSPAAASPSAGPPRRDDLASAEPPEMITTPEDQLPPSAAPDPATAAEPADAPAAAPASAPVEFSDESDARVLADGAIRVEAKRIGQTTRVVFPFETEVGAALFTRGPALWAVFDDPSTIEVAPLEDALAGYARSVEVFRAGNAQVVRVEMAEPLLATLNPDNTYWVVTIGNMAIEPTRPLPLRRVADDSGAIRLEVPFGPVYRMHRITDPSVGDELLVVTGIGSPRGLIKPQRFVEVEALSSAHGLAFVPLVDDLEATVDDQVVRLGRPAGLTLSTGAMPNRQTLLDLPGTSDTDRVRAGHVDFSGAPVVDPPLFWQKRHELSSRVADAQEPEAVVEALYDTAKFHVANGLGAEALGLLDLIEAKESQEASADRMAVLRAAGEVLMGRPKDALAELERSDLADSPDAAVWRAIAHTDLRDYAAAHRDVARGEQVIDRFPETVRKRFLLSAARTAIELNDFGKARRMISQLDPADLGGRELSELDILNARVLDSSGLAVEAVDRLAEVVRTARGAAAAEATYRLVRLQRREGLITLDQAIDRLERLAVSWRGDQLELDTLRTLGQYAIENGDHRRAFEVMRTAMQVAPDAATTRLMNEEMQSAFARLFLGGEADGMAPVDALALYYDFRELTPAGRRGDAMVRRLADRLIDVDLLPQAAELLSHQVENRLRGAARAEVAADLAMVYIMDRKPEKALRAIARTRQPELPLGVERQRRVVEGRALADTGKSELALDLLKPLKGGDIDRLRAEILWNADRHLEAGEQYERLLGSRWAEDLPLTPNEQMDVLRAGISYTLAGDQLSLDRLRSRFSAKMALTPNKLAFDTVTAPVSTAGASFDEVVRSIASIDVAEEFLADYRTRFRPSEGLAEDGAADPAVDAEPAVGQEMSAAGLPAAG